MLNTNSLHGCSHRILQLCKLVKPSSFLDPTFAGGENSRNCGGHLSIRHLTLPANFARWRRQRHPWKVVLLQSSIVVNVKMVRAETLRMTDYQRQNSGQAEVQRPRVRRGQCCLLKAILDPPLKSKNVYHRDIAQLHSCCVGLFRAWISWTPL